MSVEVNHFDSYWKHFDYLFKQICCCFAFYVYLDQATRFCCHPNARNYSGGKGRQPNDTKRNAHYGQDEGKILGRFSWIWLRVRVQLRVSSFLAPIACVISYWRDKLVLKWAMTTTLSRQHEMMRAIGAKNDDKNVVNILFWRKTLLTNQICLKREYCTGIRVKSYCVCFLILFRHPFCSPCSLLLKTGIILWGKSQTF